MAIMYGTALARPPGIRNIQARGLCLTENSSSDEGKLACLGTG